MESINTPIKGLNTDVHPKHQPKGTYRYALNAVLESSQGDLANICNELGNTVCGTRSNTKTLIGHALTDDPNKVILFYAPDEIGELDTATCTYTRLLFGSCLNFNENYPINAIFRIRNGCDRVIYFTDNYNRYRYINLSDLPNYREGGGENGALLCNKMNYSPYFITPCIDDVLVDNFGGQLPVGAHRFAVRYLDKYLNPTNWAIISNPITLVHDSYLPSSATEYGDTLNGAVNFVTTTDETGGVPHSNKAVKLLISDIDVDFQYIQIGLISYTGADGSISSVKVLKPVEITDQTQQITITGNESEVYGLSSIQEVLNDHLVVDKVETQASDNGRLFIANLEDTYTDYSKYQKFASKIQVTFDDYVPGTSFEEYGSNYHAYNFRRMSLRPGEVYALGIVYAFADGRTSPPFHIPGRPPVSNDLLAVVPGDVNNVFSPAKTQKWQLYNTGYYQTSQTYPVKLDCDGNDYWGQDYNDDDLTGTNIRHHKVPYEVRNPYLIFTNVEYPDSTVIGHYFVIGDRTGNETMLDQVIVLPTPRIRSQDEYTSDIHVFGPNYNVNDTLWIDNDPISVYDNGKGIIFYGDNEFWTSTNPPDKQLYTVISPRYIHQKLQSSGEYLKIEKILVDNLSNLTTRHDTNSDSTVILNSPLRYSEQFNIDYFGPFSEFGNHKVRINTPFPKAQPYLANVTGPNTLPVDLEGTQVVNNSVNVDAQFIRLDRPIEYYEDAFTDSDNRDLRGFIASFVSDKEVYSDLSSIKYILRDSCQHKANSTADTFAVFSGDTFLTMFSLSDHILSKEGSNFRMYGDTFNIPLYSHLNLSMRHDDLTKPVKYTQFNSAYIHDHPRFANYLHSRLYRDTPDEDATIIWPEEYLLNPDFSVYQGVREFLPLPSYFDACKTCTNSYPRRIYYSETSDQESLPDNYLIIRPNNYTDLPGESGPIKDLFSYVDKLYALTTNTAWYIPTRPQQMSTDVTNVFLGTGEVLSIPATELKTTNYAFGGTNFFKSRTITEYGPIYVDDVNGKIFHITPQLKDMTLDGLRSFFQENKLFTLDADWQQIAMSKYPFRSTTSRYDIGYITSYDPRFKRLIVTKKDYTISDRYRTKIKPLPSTTPYEADTVYYDSTRLYYSPSTNTLQTMVFENHPNIFHPTSYTASFSFLSDSWVSFHSYVPRYMYNDNTTFYTSTQFVNPATTLTEHGIFKHGTSNYQTYYNNKKPHILDLVTPSSPFEDTIASSISYTSQSYFKDLNAKEFSLSPETFDKVIVYNDRQSTGLLNMRLASSAFDSPSSANEILVKKTDNKYHFNDIWDYTNSPNLPIFTSRPSDLVPDFPIDKIPYQANIDYNKSLFNLQRLRGYYTGTRFYFKPTNNLKIATDIVATTNSYKPR